MFTKVALLCLVSVAVALPYGPGPYGAVYDDKPRPYNFGFDVKDEYGTTLNRQEVGDDLGNMKGSYGYTDAYGIYRQVDYIADDKGFQAVVKTNEPGTDNQDPADVQILSEAVPAAQVYGKGPLLAASSVSPSYIRPAPIRRQVPSVAGPSSLYQPRVSAYQPVLSKGLVAPVRQPLVPRPVVGPSYQPQPLASLSPVLKPVARGPVY